MNFNLFKLVLEKEEKPETKLPTSAGSSKKQEFQKNIYFCFIDYAKAFDCVDHNKLWKILQDMGIPDRLMPGSSPGGSRVFEGERASAGDHQETIDQLSVN